MISVQNRWKKFVVLFTICLMGALFFITNRKSSNIPQNAQEPNSKLSSSFVANNLPELKKGIYERTHSGKDAKIEFTKRGKISNLSDFMQYQEKNKSDGN